MTIYHPNATDPLARGSRQSSAHLHVHQLPCRVSSPPCRVSSPPCRVFSPPCRVSGPSCRVSSPPCRVSSLPCRVSSPTVLPTYRLDSRPPSNLSTDQFVLPVVGKSIRSTLVPLPPSITPHPHPPHPNLLHSQPTLPAGAVVHPARSPADPNAGSTVRSLNHFIWSNEDDYTCFIGVRLQVVHLFHLGVCMCECMCVCIYVCVCVSVRVCMCVYIYIYIYIYNYIYTRTLNCHRTAPHTMASKCL